MPRHYQEKSKGRTKVRPLRLSVDGLEMDYRRSLHDGDRFDLDQHIRVHEPADLHQGAGRVVR